jgi:outer membrane protein assembly factor BamD
MVMSAFTNYRQANYSEAINTATRYLSLYPNDEDAAYAQYIVGLSYYRQIPEVTRDQRTSARAIAAFTEVIERYPESEYVEDSQAKLRYARDQLAGKEMQVGRYYQERREYVAAANRYRLVVEQYPNTRQVEEALARLVETYYAMGLESEAQTAAAVLGHNYPDSQWYADSFKLLSTRGLEPRENKGSWISRAGARPRRLLKRAAMLVQLSIRDIVLIEKLDLEFDAGLSVLTGETGAGKSILLDPFARPWRPRRR